MFFLASRFSQVKWGYSVERLVRNDALTNTLTRSVVLYRVESRDWR